jgi:hypothetical protein
MRLYKKSDLRVEFPFVLQNSGVRVVFHIFQGKPLNAAVFSSYSSGEMLLLGLNFKLLSDFVRFFDIDEPR